MSSLFKIDTLRQFASFALDSTDYRPADSARVRAVPDVRTIRYYTTIGLIDRPAEMRGRTAMYSLRHVEQLVTIKRLQSEGLTLSDIQYRLIGMPAKELSQLASLPTDLQTRVLADPAQAEGASSSPDANEDAATAPATSAPATLAPPNHSDGQEGQAGQDDESRKQVPNSRRTPVSPSTTNSKRIIRISLSSSVSIDLEIDVDTDDTVGLDLDAVKRSAKPLLEEIQRQQKR